MRRLRLLIAGLILALIAIPGTLGAAQRSGPEAAGSVPSSLRSPWTALPRSAFPPASAGSAIRGTSSPSPSGGRTVGASAAPTSTPMPTPTPTPTLLPPAPPTPAPVATQPFLQIAGRAFSYKGQIVVLRGVNINNESALYLEQPTYND